MSYLRGFIPWIAFAIISSFDWRWGAITGLLIGIALLSQDHRSGVAADAQILDVSTIVYFLGLGVLALAVPDSPLEKYDGAMSFGWLALTAWGTLAVGRPFTLGIARRQTPREFWDIPEFLRINAVITIAWAVAFTLTGIALAVCTVTDAATLVGIVVHVVGLVSPAVFTSIYPARAQARIAAKNA